MSAAADSGRLARCFAALGEAGRGGLVTYIMSGDPDVEISLALLRGLPGAGADIIELGMPFTDPMADGPAIQAAGLRALGAGQTLAATLDIVRAFRQDDDDTPLVLMGYFNPVYRYGVDRFLGDAREAGVDGLIVVDLPPEEDAELCEPALAAGVNFIRLVAPTTMNDRLPLVLRHASGFVYYVSIAGITGTRAASTGDIAAAVARIRQHTGVPVAVGFGIRTPEQAGAVAAVADAAVVGSALVGIIAENLDAAGRPGPDLVDRALGFVRELATGIREGGRKAQAG